jgi:hypothetical protein
MIHFTAGYYSNNSCKTNGVKSKNLASHIFYNLTYRPGRAFFVDGHCLNRASFSPSAISAIRSKLKNVKATEDTAPYQ